MKKAIFGLQEKRGPWTFKKTRKTRFRDIFTFRVFGLFGPSPLTRSAQAGGVRPRFSKAPGRKDYNNKKEKKISYNSIKLNFLDFFC